MAAAGLALCILTGILSCNTAEGAVITLLTGKTIKGTIVKETETHVTVSLVHEGASMTLPVRKSLIRSITDDNGKTRIINSKNKNKPVIKPKAEVKPPDKKPEPAAADNEWPCWRGPGRNGITRGKGLRLKWDSGSPPPLLWQKSIGKGYSTVTVAGGKAYTMGNDGSRDTVWCFNAETGKEIWKDSYPCTSGQYPGPRSTPSVAGDTLVAFSRKGDLRAYSASDGRVLWKKNIVREVGAKRPKWDYAGSPLILSDLVVLNVGTSGTAVSITDGSIVWKTGKGRAGYATPVPVTLGGKEALLIFSAHALHAVNPANGKRLWKYGWRTNHDVNAADPIYHDGRVFISSAYNHGCALLKVSASHASKVYENRAMRNHFNSCVLHNGYLYGVDNSTLKCIEFSTGREKWKTRASRKGSLIIAGGRLVVLSERGKLIIAEADPSGFRELCKKRTGKNGLPGHQGKVDCKLSPQH